MDEKTEAEKTRIPDDLRGPVYTVVAARRTAFDTLMWQVPALGLTAQAFLLTIAYGSSSSDASRCISGGLAIAVALVAIQTMRKHQANEVTDSKLLEEIEEAFGVEVAGGRPHARPAVRGAAVENLMFRQWLVQRKSARLWLASLSMFALAAGVAIVITIFDSSLLGGGGDLRVGANSPAHSVSPARGRGR